MTSPPSSLTPTGALAEEAMDRECATRPGEWHVPVSAPEPVGDATSLFRRLNAEASGDSVLVGFDFPIGISKPYAEIAGVKAFTALLPELGLGQWADFYGSRSGHRSISHRLFFPDGQAAPYTPISFVVSGCRR